MMIETSNMIDSYTGASSEDIKAINSALKLSAYEHEELERHEKLSQLADEEVVYTIKRKVNYIWLADYIFESARDWLSIKSQKYDKRKKYPDKENYNQLVDTLKKIFQVDTLEIITMCYEGHGRYSRWITFTTDSDYIFYMTIPVIKNITIDNIDYVNYGKIGLGYYTSEHCMNTYGSSYNVMELKTVMNEILTSESCKKHQSKKELISKEENNNG